MVDPDNGLINADCFVAWSDDSDRRIYLSASGGLAVHWRILALDFTTDPKHLVPVGILMSCTMQASAKATDQSVLKDDCCEGFGRL